MVWRALGQLGLGGVSCLQLLIIPCHWPAFWHVSQPGGMGFSPQEHHPVSWLFLDLWNQDQGSGWDAHHCLPAPIRGWYIFTFCSLVFLWLIAPEQKQQPRVSYTAEVTKSWTKHSGPPPRKGLRSSTLATFSFPALLACQAATRHMPPAFSFLHHLTVQLPGFGIIISSSLDWFPFALYYSLLSPSSFPLI